MDNKTFWENQAEIHKGGVKAVNFDPLEEELEYVFLKELIKDGQKICDLGCGNGRTIFELSKAMPNSTFYGLDFSENMIKIANQQNEGNKQNNIHFYNLNAVSSDLINELGVTGFDIVLTKRLLINLKGECKYKAIKNIYDLLDANGRYIMVECFIEPLDEINRIRSILNLKQIEVKHFNEYLTKQFTENIQQLFKIERVLDFESMYYFISRVFNAKLTDGTPDYYAPINQVAVQLIKSGISPIKGYSPEKLLVMRKTV